MDSVFLFPQITNLTNLNTVFTEYRGNQPVGSLSALLLQRMWTNPTLSYYLINGAGDIDNSSCS